MTIMEQKLPKLLPRILAQQMKSDDIKVELHAWGVEARAAAIDYFRVQGLDIVALVGDAYLDQALRWAADRVSPFPGSATAVTLAQEEWSNKLVAHGVDWVREHWLKQQDAVTSATGGSSDV